MTDVQLVTAALAIVVAAAIMSVVIGLVYRSIKACLSCATAAVTAVILAAGLVYAWRLLGG